MRILFVHDNAWVCQSLAGALSRKGHPTYVITRGRFSEDWYLGAKCVSEADTYKLIPTLASILTYRDVDIINSNNYASWVAAQILGRFLGVPHIVTLHGTDLRFLFQGMANAFKRRLLIETLKASDMVLATSADLISYSHILGREILHLPQPIDTTTFNDHAPRNESLVGDPIVFSPTRLQKIKGVVQIVEILAKLCQEYPRCRIYQVNWGEPEYVSVLASKISSKNLRFVNKIPRDLLPSWYVSADIVIGQMRLGILSNIELEAMSCKAPVLVYDRYYDYGCTRNDLKTVWETVHSIISDHTFRGKLVEKGSRIISERHDLNKVVELYLHYLERVVLAHVMPPESAERARR